MKLSFFQAVVVSILLYGCTTWKLTKRLEKKLDGNYARILRAILNKSWRQHPTRYKLYGHLPHIAKTMQVRRTRYARHCWRSRNELMSDVILWTSTCGWAKAGRPARTYIQKLCEDTGCSPEDLPNISCIYFIFFKKKTISGHVRIIHYFLLGSDGVLLKFFWSFWFISMLLTGWK